MKIKYWTIFIFLFSAAFSQIPPSPEDVLNFEIGEDYKLADFQQISDYFQLLAQSSNRIMLENLGSTFEGNQLFVAMISAPTNLSQLADYHSIQSNLADPRKINDQIADSLIQLGRTIVCINCSIHSTEIGASQMSMQLAYELASQQNPETQEILDNVILCLLPVHNPDGLSMVVKWYRQYWGTKYDVNRLPWLYHQYTGHDINRDWIMLTQPETRLTVEKIYNVWHPQIVLDMHQMSIKAPRLFIPPYTDPIDPHVDPILVSEIAMLGHTIVADLTAQGLAGVATNVIFDAWSPSRAYVHYHGGVRILSEVASCDVASPIKVDWQKDDKNNPFDLTSPSWNYVLPWYQGEWHLSDIVKYDREVARSLLIHAAKYREKWLRNFYLVGKNAVTSQTLPYAYIIPQQQWDKSTLYELLYVMHIGGIEIHRAENDFNAGDENFPTGTYIILMNQPFSAYARTLLEAQKYPENLYGKAYDLTGHTLSYLMGVTVIPIEKTFQAQLILLDSISLNSGTIQSSTEDSNYVIFSNQSNYAYKAMNRLLSKNYRLYWLNEPVYHERNGFGSGSIIVAAKFTDPIFTKLADYLGVDFTALPQNLLPASAIKLTRPRLGLYQSWVPCIDEGWTRFVLEEHEFQFESAKDSIIRAGDLEQYFDVLIIPSLTATAIKAGNDSTKMPPRFCGGIGEIGIKNLKKFVHQGGNLIVIDSAVKFAVDEFELSVKIASPQKADEGSILKIRINTEHPLGYGLPNEAGIVFFKSSILQTDSGNIIARYANQNLLMSGALTGEKLLQKKPAVVEFNYGNGRIILFGFKPVFRAQTRGVYKLLFNSIFYANAEELR